ncbi:uncharacterized protein L201_000046 [Kwoniella dendrophila CBS 6074]|uniref:Uncharacterized protein n=1 Tax=Kwoniella dendrophila CBS 6074 TaxID=1295534 RepID=A0AAX4JJU6_9TREE
MSTKQLFNLPKLIASLPSSSSTSTTKPILVKPLNWPHNSFYLVTRQDLQFSTTTVNEPKGKAAETITTTNEDENGVVNPIEDQVNVKGRVWGLKFWQGHPYPRQSPKISDPKIPNASKEQFVPVDLSSLSSDIKQRVLEGQKLVEQRRRERREVLKKKL